MTFSSYRGINKLRISYQEIIRADGIPEVKQLRGEFHQKFPELSSEEMALLAVKAFDEMANTKLKERLLVSSGSAQEEIPNEYFSDNAFIVEVTLTVQKQEFNGGVIYISTVSSECRHHKRGHCGEIPNGFPFGFALQEDEEANKKLAMSGFKKALANVVRRLNQGG